MTTPSLLSWNDPMLELRELSLAMAIVFSSLAF
jgi:hypothetical protein